jgi:hypothetical protein
MPVSVQYTIYMLWKISSCVSWLSDHFSTDSADLEVTPHTKKVVLLFSISDYMKNTKYQTSSQLPSLCKSFIFFLSTDSSFKCKFAGLYPVVHYSYKKTDHMAAW